MWTKGDKFEMANDEKLVLAAKSWISRMQSYCKIIEKFIEFRRVFGILFTHERQQRLMEIFPLVFDWN